MNSYNLYVKEEMFKLKENTKLTGQERMRIIRKKWQNSTLIPLINPFSIYL